MTSRSRSVKRKQEVTGIEDGEKTFPFDDVDSTSVEDPLAIRTDKDDDLNYDEAEMKTVKQEVDDCDGDKGRRQHENSGKLVKVIIKVEAASKKVRKKGSGRPRKYATPEARRQAEAEQRQLRRAQISEEARQEILRKQRESNRRRRAEMKAEKKEEILRKQRESSRKRRAEMNSEKREEILRKMRENSRKRWAEMKEEKRGEALRKMREEGHKRRAEIKEEAGTRVLNTETVERNSVNEPNVPDQTAEDSQPKRKLSRYEELREKQREYAKRRRESHAKHEEDKKKRREAIKRLKEENPEEYAIWRAMVNQKRREQRKANAASQIKKPQKEETDEEREMRIMKNRLRYKKSRETPEAREMIRFRQYSRIQMQMAQMTDEELAAFKAKQREANKKWRENLTGEKLEKYRAYLRNKLKMNYKRRLETLGEVYKAEVNARYRHYVANETPEQRQRRLRRYKINQAVTKLRKQLEEIDVPPEEVERRVMELRSTMEAEPLPPPETLSKYKPRVKSEVNFTFPPRSTEGKRRGRPPGCSRKIDSNSVASCDSQSQPVMVTSEMDDSNDFNDNYNGFHCDSTFDDDVKEQIETGANLETTTTESEPLPIFRFDIKCPHCPSIYSERTDLMSHISLEHSKICWKCPKCKLIVLSSDELSDHFKTVHLQIPNGSTDPTTITSKPVSKETSSKKGHNFFCMKCDPVKSPHFEKVKDLMTHVKSAHPRSFWPCSKCNILKYTESALKVHKNFCKRLEKSVKPNGQKNVVKK